MDTESWFAKVNENDGALRNLITNYHPLCSKRGWNHHLPITAPNAERACSVVRDDIKKKGTDRNPLLEFQQALDSRDVAGMTKVLNETWFGVPESTSAWCILGFEVVCDLLGDPPEEEGVSL